MAHWFCFACSRSGASVALCSRPKRNRTGCGGCWGPALRRGSRYCPNTWQCSRFCRWSFIYSAVGGVSSLPLTHGSRRSSSCYCSCLPCCGTTLMTGLHSCFRAVAPCPPSSVCNEQRWISAGNCFICSRGSLWGCCLRLRVPCALHCGTRQGGCSCVWLFPLSWSSRLLDCGPRCYHTGRQSAGCSLFHYSGSCLQDSSRLGRECCGGSRPRLQAFCCAPCQWLRVRPLPVTWSVSCRSLRRATQRSTFSIGTVCAPLWRSSACDAGAWQSLQSVGSTPGKPTTR